jgi:hypothetical protein
MPDRWYKIGTFVGFALLFGFHSFILNITENDVSLGFRNTVLLQKQVVNYAEEKDWQSKVIYSAFLMQYYLAVPELGYLNKDKPFYHVKNKPEIDYDVFIFCSNEADPKREQMQKDPVIALIRKFEKDAAWVEVYGKRRILDEALDTP